MSCVSVSYGGDDFRIGHHILKTASWTGTRIVTYCTL